MPYKIENITPELITSDVNHNTSVSFILNGSEYIIKPSESIFIDYNGMLTTEINKLIVQRRIDVHAMSKTDFDAIIELEEDLTQNPENELIIDDITILDEIPVEKPKNNKKKKENNS